MKTRILILLAVFCGATVVANAQQTIKFDKTEHDFGNVAEKGGPVTYSFEFTNTGTEPILVQNVQASCGCTTPGWTKEPIAPGARGFVKATYMPSAAVSFDKSLTVTASGNSAVVLRIRGKVVAKMPTVEEAFPVAYDALRLRAAQLPMARIAQGATKKDSLEIINNGTDNLTLTFSGVPSQIALDVVPATLKAGEKGFIRCTYTTAKKKEWGNVNYPISIKANGKAVKNGKIAITATIVDDFAKLTPADYEKAPIATVANATVNFGELAKSADYTAEYEISNTGKSDLIIHKAESENANVKITAPSTIKPGAAAKIQVVVKTKNETAGEKLYSVTLVTNAPNQSSLYLMLTGKIK